MGFRRIERGPAQGIAIAVDAIVLTISMGLTIISAAVIGRVTKGVQWH